MKRVQMKGVLYGLLRLACQLPMGFMPAGQMLKLDHLIGEKNWKSKREGREGKTVENGYDVFGHGETSHYNECPFFRLFFSPCLSITVTHKLLHISIILPMSVGVMVRLPGRR